MCKNTGLKPPQGATGSDTPTRCGTFASIFPLQPHRAGGLRRQVAAPRRLLPLPAVHTTAVCKQRCLLRCLQPCSVWVLCARAWVHLAELISSLPLPRSSRWCVFPFFPSDVWRPFQPLRKRTEERNGEVKNILGFWNWISKKEQKRNEYGKNEKPNRKYKKAIK